MRIMILLAALLMTAISFASGKQKRMPDGYTEYGKQVVSALKDCRPVKLQTGTHQHYVTDEILGPEGGVCKYRRNFGALGPVDCFLSEKERKDVADNGYDYLNNKMISDKSFCDKEAD